jgi:hypothetical protein
MAGGNSFARNSDQEQTAVSLLCASPSFPHILISMDVFLTTLTCFRCDHSWFPYFQLTDEDITLIAALDTGQSAFFDHRNPEVVKRLSTAKRNT